MECKWGEKTSENRSYLVDLMVELYGIPCKNRLMQPAGSKSPWHAIIDEARADCDVTFSTDNVYSILADKQLVSKFVKDSTVLTTTSMGSTLYTDILKDTTREAQLYGRYKIEVKCSATC